MECKDGKNCSTVSGATKVEGNKVRVLSDNIEVVERKAASEVDFCKEFLQLSGLGPNFFLQEIMASSSAYRRLMLKIASVLPEKFRAAFLHPAGPTTVFFWAPTFKWGLVIAGIGDINRPVDTISLSQTASLMITGAIWSRYSLVIIPKNYNLFSVNLFTCATGAYNFTRGLLYQMAQK
ncbi:Brain protein 44 [Cyphomyrmex costatus]|uniref:Mitochondrial pyruvate carrier n=1 Tax=Cyphomyrmex costatus TaxID=456900 RepID=A0A151IQA0_9HYME|nr:Brain protein 44 [Cyphomyrmex costatus]